MAQDIVGGLFGIQQEPNYYNQDYQTAIALANANDSKQMGRFLGGMIGAPLGRAVAQGVGGLLGVEDPRLKQQRVIAEAKAQGFDTTTPEGLQQIASFFVQNGEPGLASQVAQQAQSMSRSAAEEQYKLAQAQAALREKKGTPEHQAQQIRLSQLQAQYGEEEGANRFMIEQQQLAERRSPKTTVNVVSQQESEFSKELGKIQGKQMEGAYNTRNAAVKTLDTLSKMATLNDSELISGSFSGPRQTTANFLNTIGLASQADAKRLANSQQFDKVAGDLVLSNIKQLGYNPSNADVTFLNKTLPNLEASAEARKALINWMASKAQGSISEVKNMEQYAIKNKSLNGYTPVVPNFNPTGGTGTKVGVQALSNEELAAQIARLKGNK